MCFLDLFAWLILQETEIKSFAAWLVLTSYFAASDVLCAESEAHDSIPESLLRGVLEAEREQHTRAAEQKQKSSQMEQANVAEAATLQEQHPAVSNSVAESGGVVDAGMPETDLQA